MMATPEGVHHRGGALNEDKENSNPPSPRGSPASSIPKPSRPTTGSKLRTPVSSASKLNSTRCNGEVTKNDMGRPRSSTTLSPASAASPRTPASNASPRTPINQRTPVSSKEPMCHELTKLENDIKSKEMDLVKVAAENKALKLTERQKDKAIAELSGESKKLKEKVQSLEKQLESKALELRKMTEDKNKAVADCQAAEGTLRRLHSSQRDSSFPSLEAAMAPLEAELKMKSKEIGRLQEDAKAMERLTRSKEAALLEAEKKVTAAETALSAMEDLRNTNQELVKQIDTLQEQKKSLEKVQRQKVADIEQLSARVEQLHEALSRSGEAANMLLESQQEVQKLQRDKRTLEQELARTKVTANRVAIAAAAEWKDDSDKVIPVRQWVEERRYLQGELKALQEKLELAQRQAKSEVQKKDRLQQRLKVIEDCLKTSSAGKAVLRRLSGSSRDLIMQSPRTSENGDRSPFMNEARSEDGSASGDIDKEGSEHGGEDVVSGLLYDLLQKEVVALRKVRADQEQSLQERAIELETLTKKCGTLERALKTETDKNKRELNALRKELSTMRTQVSSKEGEAREREEQLKKETFRLKAKLYAIQQSAV